MPFASAVNHVDPNGFRTDDWRDSHYFELSKLHVKLGIIPLEVAQEKKKEAMGEGKRLSKVV